MGTLDSLKLERKAFSIATLFEPSDEKDYWLSKTPYERMEAIETIGFDLPVVPPCRPCTRFSLAQMPPAG